MLTSFLDKMVLKKLGYVLFSAIVGLTCLFSQAAINVFLLPMRNDLMQN